MDEINYAPQVPAAVDVQSVVCQGETNVIYSVEEKMYYTWSYSVLEQHSQDRELLQYQLIIQLSNLRHMDVTPSNGCGNGPHNMSIVVNELPVQPSIITGETSICPSANGIEYSVKYPRNCLFMVILGEGASILDKEQIQ